MEIDMAELINLEGADKALQKCGESIEKLKKLTEHSYSGGTIWSKEQLEQINLLYFAIHHLERTVHWVMHNNRDGRGTPPAKARLNSMMDRAR
jgi:hypothetical protein